MGTSTRTMGISVTDVDTEAKLPLGFEYHEPADTTNGYGERVWVYVFNDEASSAYAVGNIIYRDPSATTEDFWGGLITPVTVHQPKLMVLGVAQHAIAAGSYGFVLKRGVGTILAGAAALTLDTPFTSGGATTAGTAIDYADDAATLSSNLAVIGHSATAISGDATGTAFISCGL
mgnify:CR=1 FL=1